VGFDSPPPRQILGFLTAKKVSFMDNQHKKISGYRDLTQGEVDAMNAIKQKSTEVGVLLEEMRDNKELDSRWIDIAETQLQQGFMAAVRAVAKPTTF